MSQQLPPHPGLKHRGDKRQEHGANANCSPASRQPPSSSRIDSPQQTAPGTLETMEYFTELCSHYHLIPEHSVTPERKPIPIGGHSIPSPSPANH